MPRHANVLVIDASRGLGATLADELLVRGHRGVMTASTRGRFGESDLHLARTPRRPRQLPVG